MLRVKTYLFRLEEQIQAVICVFAPSQLKKYALTFIVLVPIIGLQYRG
jgi:hypothetical protein